MLQLPIQPVASQNIKAVLAGQNCQILAYQKPQGLFVDVSVDGVDIVSGIIARNAVPIVCRGYAGFVGNLLIIDTQGTDDPYYTGLGTRFQLVYLTEAENALIV